MNHLSELAEAEINDLRSRGIEPTLNEMIWINDLARDVVAKGRRSRNMGVPFRAGNVWLWPFTIQGQEWYSVAMNWSEADTEFSTLVLAYALAHGRNPEAFSFIYEYNEAKKAISAWKEKLGCTYGELCEAVIEVLPDNDTIELSSDEEAEERASTEWNDLVAWLCKEVGETREFWRSSVSVDYVMTQIKVISDQASATSDRIGANEPYVKATKQLGRALISIKERADEIS